MKFLSPQLGHVPFIHSALRISALSFLIGFGALSTAEALPVNVGSGSLSVLDGEIYATNQWNDGNFSIDYDVTLDGTLFTYNYRLYVPSKDLSHWLLQVSESFTSDNLIAASGDTGVDPSGNPTTFDASGPGNSNPGLPTNLFGYKWDETTGTGYLDFQLVTDRAPMWGSFYAKDGNSGGPGGGTAVYAYNTGLNPQLDSQAYLLVPDTENSVVPEPASAALLLVGLVAAGIKRRMS